MKKGFTLIEVIAVIAILAIIALIAYPSISDTIKSSKEKAYVENVNNIENAASRYSLSHSLGYDEDFQSLQLQALKEEGLLKDKDIKNPIDNSTMQGCVLYRWDTTNNQYEFKYSEECVIP